VVTGGICRWCSWVTRGVAFGNRGAIVAKTEPVDICVGVTLFGATTLDGDDAFLDETLDAGDDGLATHAGAIIENAAIASLDALSELGKRDGVGALAEAEGAPDDVEEDAEFGFLEAGSEQVEDVIRDNGTVGPAETFVVKFILCRHDGDTVLVTKVGTGVLCAATDRQCIGLLLLAELTLSDERACKAD